MPLYNRTRIRGQVTCWRTAARRSLEPGNGLLIITGQSPRGPWRGEGGREDWSQMLPDLREGTFQATQSSSCSSQSRTLHPGKEGVYSAPRWMPRELLVPRGVARAEGISLSLPPCPHGPVFPGIPWMLRWGFLEILFLRSWLSSWICLPPTLAFPSGE